MRTARSLTVSRSITCICGGGGVCPPPRMQTVLDADPPSWTDKKTCVRKLPSETSFAGSNYAVVYNEDSAAKSDKIELLIKRTNFHLLYMIILNKQMLRNDS